MFSNLPLSLPSQPGWRDEDGIVVAVVRVLVAPCRLTLTLPLLGQRAPPAVALLPCGLRSPAASRRVLRPLRLTAAPRRALCRGRSSRAAGGVARRLCRCGRRTVLLRRLWRTWRDVTCLNLLLSAQLLVCRTDLELCTWSGYLKAIFVLITFLFPFSFIDF